MGYALAFGFFKFINYAMFFWLPFFLSLHFDTEMANLISSLYSVLPRPTSSPDTPLRTRRRLPRTRAPTTAPLPGGSRAHGASPAPSTLLETRRETRRVSSAGRWA